MSSILKNSMGILLKCIKLHNPYKLIFSNWSNENMKTGLCSSYPASSHIYKSIASTLPLHKNPLLNYGSHFTGGEKTLKLK
jgi:hypothetical protein